MWAIITSAGSILKELQRLLVWAIDAASIDSLRFSISGATPAGTFSVDGTAVDATGIVSVAVGASPISAQVLMNSGSAGRVLTIEAIGAGGAVLKREQYRVRNNALIYREYDRPLSMANAWADYQARLADILRTTGDKFIWNARIVPFIKTNPADEIVYELGPTQPFDIALQVNQVALGQGAYGTVNGNLSIPFSTISPERARWLASLELDMLDMDLKEVESGRRYEGVAMFELYNDTYGYSFIVNNVPILSGISMNTNGVENNSLSNRNSIEVITTGKKSSEIMYGFSRR